MKRARKWLNQHNTLLKVISIFLTVIIIPLIILLLKEIGLFTTNTDGWLSFMGGFIGGIATMISVVITIRHGDKERSKEKRENKRVFLDIMYHSKASEKMLRDFEPDTFKTLYLFDGEITPENQEQFDVLQIINRSTVQVNQVKIIMTSKESNGKEHTRFANIPYIQPSERDFMILPKPLYTSKPITDPTVLLKQGKTKPVEEIVRIRVKYKTLGGEIIELIVDSGLSDFKYWVDNEQIFSYKYASATKVLIPKS